MIAVAAALALNAVILAWACVRRRDHDDPTT